MSDAMYCSNCGNKIKSDEVITSSNNFYCYEPDCALKAEENDWMMFSEALNEDNSIRALPVEERICVVYVL